ncbi:MAG: helix-turn-helix domain-containing protein [Legionellales bacterium]|nr:helix-turn-helix domain-containing protein [Legionellales bacterium]
MSYINNTTFIKAIRFIYDNINQPMQLEDIAKSVGVSLSSLKRLFNELIDQSPGYFIRRLRMEFAFLSLQQRQDSILEIALNAGFEDQAAFSRSFKEIFGYSPRHARQKLNIINELDAIILNDPDIVYLSDLSLQGVTERGIYFESAPRAWNNLKNKLLTEEINDDFSGMYVGIGHDNPHDGAVAPDEVRFTAGVTLLKRNLELDHMTIAKGYYARFYYQGKINNLGLAYHYIYGKWAESSAVNINSQQPAFTAFTDFPNALHEETILIHVPLSL